MARGRALAAGRSDRTVVLVGVGLVVAATRAVVQQRDIYSDTRMLHYQLSGYSDSVHICILRRTS